MPQSGASPSFDRAAALERVDGDLDFLKQLAGMLLGQCGAQVEQIAAAVAQGDPQQIMKSAHALKGGVANLSAHEVYEAAQRLEMKGQQGNLDGVAADLGDLRRAAERLKAALSQFIAEPLP